MSISEKSERKGFIQAPALSENMLLAIIAVGFCILHILTLVFLVPPSAIRTAAPSLEQTLALYD
ncbi:hypothetical protein [Bradyrhizobium neotropicale]|uniref:Uncharacterized protein n=1 Tax=Bradyrhizobium neotropicale TaxID=1497615 RepID=A0A176YNW4_9BRAD|nr:hypothetical protein [Bradyrhizobium neotropicale]OAF07855.1 hypothetical protein AXW67_29220 [Bradyrhizobium neotropicale]